MLPELAGFLAALRADPPDPAAAASLADLLAERGATDAEVCRLAALPPEWWRRVRLEGSVAPHYRGRRAVRGGWCEALVRSEYDGSLLPLLPEWDRVQAGFAPPAEWCRCFPSRVGGEAPDPACPLCHGTGWVDGAARRHARAAAVRGLRAEKNSVGLWCVVAGEECCSGTFHNLPAEPAARLALKRAVLALYDDVRIPCRAEGWWLTVRGGGYEREVDPAHLLGRPQNGGAAYFLDGARVGGPPGWAWTPRRVPCARCKGAGRTGSVRPYFWGRLCPDCGGAGSRLRVEWETTPAGLLPAEDRPPCTECGGAGLVVRGGPGHGVDTTCRACDGSGYDDEAARRRAGMPEAPDLGDLTWHDIPPEALRP